MDDRQALLLALGITEWAGAVAHFDAMRHRRVNVPPDIERQIGLELAFMVRQWPAAPGVSVTAVIADARRYCTEHVADLDALLAETRTP